MEANPESITGPWLAAAAVRYTRLSIGIQSLHDPLLRAVGRREASMQRKALDTVADFWHGQLSVDLICGIPGQTDTMLLDDIREVSRYPVDHVSCIPHGRTGNPLSRRLETLPVSPPDNEQDLWFSARDALEEAGFAV